MKFQVCSRFIGPLASFDTKEKARAALKEVIDADAEDLVRHGIFTDAGYIDAPTHDQAVAHAAHYFFIEEV